MARWRGADMAISGFCRVLGRETQTHQTPASNETGDDVQVLEMRLSRRDLLAVRLNDANMPRTACNNAQFERARAFKCQISSHGRIAGVFALLRWARDQRGVLFIKYFDKELAASGAPANFEGSILCFKYSSGLAVSVASFEQKGDDLCENRVRSEGDCGYGNRCNQKKCVNFTGN